MLIHVNGTCASAIRITAGGIVPHSSRARCKPHVERVEEDAIRIVWVHGDSLVVPVLGIVALATSAVSERAALRTLHISPARATVCGSPRAKLATIRTAAAAIAIRHDGLALCVNVIWVTRRDANVNSPELVAGVDVNKRRAAAGVHGRPCRVR